MRLTAGDRTDLFNITEKDIRMIADSAAILQRGKAYYRGGRIKHIEFDMKKEAIIAVVEGDSGTYGVKISAKYGDIDEDDAIDAECTCPYGLNCKHIVAALYKWLSVKDRCEFRDNFGKNPEGLQKKKEKKEKEKSKSKAKENEKNEAHFTRLMFEELKKQSSKETLLEAFEIAKSGGVALKMPDKETVSAEVAFGKTESVFISYSGRSFLYSENFSKRCTCGAPNYYDICVHAAAAMLKAFIEYNSATGLSECEEYMSKIRAKIQNEKYPQLIQSLASIERAQDTDNEASAGKYGFFFSIERERDTIKISIKKAMLKDGGYRRPANTTPHLVRQNYPSMSEEKRAAIHLLMSASRDWNPGTARSISETTENAVDIELLARLRELYKKEPESFFNCAFPSEPASVEIRIESAAQGAIRDNLQSTAQGEKAEEEAEAKAKAGAEACKEAAEAYVLRTYGRIGGKCYNLCGSGAFIIGREDRNRPLWVYAYDHAENKPCLFELKTKCPDIVKALAAHSFTQIAQDQLKAFIEKYYVNLSAVGEVVLPKKHAIEERLFSPFPRIFLKDHGSIFRIELRFLYSVHQVPYGTRHDIVVREGDKIIKIKRSAEDEKRHYAALLENQTMEKNGVLVPSINPYEWLDETAKSLISKGFEIYGADKLFNQRLVQKDPTLMLEVSSGIDWFDLKGSVECAGEKIPFDSVLSAINNQERFIKLSDGRMGVIPKKWVEKLSGVSGFLQYDNMEEKAKASNSQIAIIEALLDIADSAKTDRVFDEIREKFRRFSEIKDMPVPKNMKGELRNYQKAGYNWLHFLKEFSFGGCLADEMGLGKTFQVLALLAYEKEAGAGKPSLIVVPTSLVFNWVAEAAKFTPDLKIYVHHGQNRLSDYKDIAGNNCDIIVTTYGTLRNDIDIFKDNEFHYIVLDESQQIKNPLSKNAKSAYSLKSRYRLALTGTPIENNSLELWSQFAFLNPGLLGNMDYFKEMFAKSIEKDKDKAKMASLKNIIDPFLLRRKKETVAIDLPEKQITTLYCDMEEEQRKIYDFWKEKFRSDIQETIQQKGFMQSRMKILEGLTKLRQICNHPALVDESYAGESGKFNAIKEQIEEVIEAGHKALIFSSFVKMLAVFRKYFDEKNIRYSYLDGSTINRKEVVEEFQNDGKIPVFLISLKAGGLGLNLTSADYVFIVDPWWNPAAEMQAIDRAHRIGQKKSVFVYKTITKDSVEEKILELQEAKLDLVKNVVVANEGIFKKLNLENIDMMFR